MTDRPILFSPSMIRAILREIAAPGTGKTQTRRIIQPYETVPHPFKGAKAVPSNLVVVKAPAHLGGFIDGPTFNPRFAPGDRLWVREAHALVPRTAYRMSIGTGTIAQQEHPTDGYSAALFREGFDRSGRPRWRPGIHMPRWASRLTLHVTDVRVQRLQGISDADARAEGVESASEFRDLWDSLNAERAPWVSNPWVVAVTFRPLLENIDRVTA